jgi:hypothetical protein
MSSESVIEPPIQVARVGCMGVKGDLQCYCIGKVLRRSYERGIRHYDLEGETWPDALAPSIKKRGSPLAGYPASIGELTYSKQSNANLEVCLCLLSVIAPDAANSRHPFRLSEKRVLQFVFYGNSANRHLPQKYLHSLMAYATTDGDNSTRGWFESLSGSQQRADWEDLERCPGARGPGLVERN